MTQVALVAWILTSVCDLGRKDGVPSGHLYQFVMGDCTLDDYNSALAILTDNGMVTSEAHLLKPTEKGIELGAKINAQLEARRTAVKR